MTSTPQLAALASPVTLAPGVAAQPGVAAGGGSGTDSRPAQGGFNALLANEIKQINKVSYLYDDKQDNELKALIAQGVQIVLDDAHATAAGAETTAAGTALAVAPVAVLAGLPGALATVGVSEPAGSGGDQAAGKGLPPADIVLPPVAEGAAIGQAPTGASTAEESAQASLPATTESAADDARIVALPLLHSGDKQLSAEIAEGVAELDPVPVRASAGARGTRILQAEHAASAGRLHAPAADVLTPGMPGHAAAPLSSAAAGAPPGAAVAGAAHARIQDRAGTRGESVPAPSATPAPDALGVTRDSQGSRGATVIVTGSVPHAAPQPSVTPVDAAFGREPAALTREVAETRAARVDSATDATNPPRGPIVAATVVPNTPVPRTAAPAVDTPRADPAAPGVALARVAPEGAPALGNAAPGAFVAPAAPVGSTPAAVIDAAPGAAPQAGAAQAATHARRLDSAVSAPGVAVSSAGSPGATRDPTSAQNLEAQRALAAIGSPRKAAQSGVTNAASPVPVDVVQGERIARAALGPATESGAWPFEPGAQEKQAGISRGEGAGAFATAQSGPPPSPLAAPRAAPAAPGAVPLPLGADQGQWNEQLGAHIRWLSAGAMKSADIRLDPPDLGPLQVQVHAHRDGTSVQFTTHSTMVRDVLEQSLPRLREMLEGSGMNLLDVNVAHQQGGREQGAREGVAAAGGPYRETRADTDPNAAAERGARAPLGLIDYYA